MINISVIYFVKSSRLRALAGRRRVTLLNTPPVPLSNNAYSTVPRSTPSIHATTQPTLAARRDTIPAGRPALDIVSLMSADVASFVTWRIPGRPSIDHELVETQ